MKSLIVRLACVSAVLALAPSAHGGAVADSWRETPRAVGDICEWLFGSDPRPRVGPVELRETLVLDAEGRRALASLLRDRNTSFEDKAGRGIELWTGLRLAQLDDPFDPILREIVDRLAIDWRDDAGDLRTSTKTLRWPRALATPALVIACYAHVLERMLQFYEFFGLIQGGLLPPDQAWRDWFVDLIDVSTERMLERGGMGAEWEILHATPHELRGAEVDLLADAELDEFVRDRYQFMLGTGGLDFGRYLRLQYASGRGTRWEIVRHNVRKILAALEARTTPAP